MEITQNNAEILRASQGNPEIWTRPVWTFGIADLGNIRFISFCFEHVGQDKSGQGITGTIYNPFTQIPCERYLSASCNVDSLILFEYMKEHKKDGIVAVQQMERRGCLICNFSMFTNNYYSNSVYGW